MNKCEYFPEITNCVKCKYFDLREYDNGFSDYESVCLKREEEKTKRIEEKKQIFAEWLTDFILTHPRISITISQGIYGCLEISMIRETSSGLKQKCSYLSTIDIYSQAEINLDKELIDICETLVKEIENYGS